MTDRAAFLRAIRAAPADDTPRLVFADWLDEHDDPAWAELIRVQVELEPIHEELDNPRRRGLADRETELLARHADRWLGPAHDIAAEYPAYGPVFRRGLPESVSLSLDTFLARGGELFAACPTVREVCVYGVQGRGPELLSCPHLARVETLEIADWVSEVDLLDTGVGRLREVRRFRLWGDLDHFFPEQLARLSTPDWPDAIEVIDLDENRERFGYTRADMVNEDVGREVVRVVRPFDGRFPLAEGVGHGLYPGTNDTGDPVLLAIGTDGSGVAIQFDADGRYVNAETVDGLTPAALAAWQATRGRSIRLREFHTPRLILRLWPESYVRDYLTNPFDRPAGVTDRWWDHRGGVLKRWLHEGRFVIEWDGREFVLDASGTVVTS